MRAKARDQRAGDGWAPCADEAVEVGAVKDASHSTTSTRAFTCFKCATIVNVKTTSSDHELHFPTCTADHAPS